MTIKRFIFLSALCLVAAALNPCLSVFSLNVLKLPVFLDTVFTAAVTFYAGLIPGLITAILTASIGVYIDGAFTPFGLCAITEVFIVYLLKPKAAFDKQVNDAATVATCINIFSRLMLLYIVACFAVSILGALIAYIWFTVLPNTKENFSAEDFFKIGLARSNIHSLPMNIISRIPVNLIDRFIVIFGGYFISYGFGKLVNYVSQKLSKPVEKKEEVAEN
ncbi:MAG: hypothetical protein FWD47_04240 [Treponema sp.]|nr:hypothetical protein [Treponema sp.]